MDGRLETIASSTIGIDDPMCLALFGLGPWWESIAAGSDAAFVVWRREEMEVEAAREIARFVGCGGRRGTTPFYQRLGILLAGMYEMKACFTLENPLSIERVHLVLSRLL